MTIKYIGNTIRGDAQNVRYNRSNLTLNNVIKYNGNTKGRGEGEMLVILVQTEHDNKVER